MNKKVNAKKEAWQKKQDGFLVYSSFSPLSISSGPLA